MEFRILGPLEVLSDGQALDLGGQKQRALLALLLLEANRPVSRDRLIAALWEEEPTATAQKAIQVYVSQLRKLLGKERLLTRAPGYLLHAEADELDLTHFRRLQSEGKQRDALALWRAPALAEFAELRFAQTEIARLEELRLACLEERLDADLAEGRQAELVGELEALVREYPLRERLRELLLVALYRSAARQKRSPPTRTRALRSSTSSESSPAKRCASSIRRSCVRTRRSTSCRPTSPRPRRVAASSSVAKPSSRNSRQGSTMRLQAADVSSSSSASPASARAGSPTS